MNKKVCLFCGANTGNSTDIVQQVEILSDLLIQQGFDLVYGGGNGGLMGIVAEKFLSKGQKVIGIRPQHLIVEESANYEVTESIVVKDMFERKAKMMEAADIFIALPGGVGTLDEIIEVYTQVKIGFVNKFCGILDTNNYYEGLEVLLSRMVKDGFLKASDKTILKIAPTPQDLMQKIVDYLDAQKLH